MNTIIFILDLLGIGGILGAHQYTRKQADEFFMARLREQDAAVEDRNTALYKQQKATAKLVNQSDRAVRKMIDEHGALQEDTRLAHQRIDALARTVQERL